MKPEDQIDNSPEWLESLSGGTLLALGMLGTLVVIAIVGPVFLLLFWRKGQVESV